MNAPVVRLIGGTSVAYQTPDGIDCFGGYYDKPVLSADGRFLLSHVYDAGRRVIEGGEACRICIWNVKSGRCTIVEETRTWNWQQGAMLQWLPGGDGHSLLFNTYDDREKRYVATVVNSDGHRRVLPNAVYTVDRRGEMALCVNWERLYFCRPGYNYAMGGDLRWNHHIPDGDGIRVMNLTTGSTTSVIALNDIVKRSYGAGRARVDHWVEHCMWNPSATYFAFLHRCNAPGKWADHRLYTASANGSDIVQYDKADLYSHMAWRNDSEFVMWMIPEIGVGKSIYRRTITKSRLARRLSGVYRWARQALVPRGVAGEGSRCGFTMFEVGKKRGRPLGSGLLFNEDGHPSWVCEGRIMVVDTYPDKEGWQHLWMWAPERRKAVHCASVRSFGWVDDVRVDLHPRVSEAYGRIVIDAATETGSSMIVLNVEEPLSELMR